MRRFVFGAGLVLLFTGGAGAQQFPILDAVANKVIQKYQTSSCPQLMAERDQPKGPEEQRAIQLLHDDSQMRQEFIRRVAAPIASKLFECRMIP